MTKIKRDERKNALFKSASTPSDAFVTGWCFAFGLSILDDPFGGASALRRLRKLLAAAADRENQGRNGYDRGRR